MYGRFGFGLGPFLRKRITVSQAQKAVRWRLAHREELFLRLARKGIFGYSRSPYLPLLRAAGIDFSRLRSLVLKQGLENALEELYERGVYIDFEEFKGYKPIVRNGVKVDVTANDFDNPYLTQCYAARTGGSTGAGKRVAVDLEQIYWECAWRILVCESHGIIDQPYAAWRPTLPASSGFFNVLRQVVLGNPAREWFVPIDLSESTLKRRCILFYVLLVSRLFGGKIPVPRLSSLSSPRPLLKWIKSTLEDEGPCVVSAGVSMAVRACLGAAEQGLSLEGVTFHGGGEPPTPEKVSTMHETGARWIPNYATTEAGGIGSGCAEPLDGSDVHVALDSFALVQRKRSVEGIDGTVDALYLTTLSPAASKLMLNTGLDDYAIVERRDCGCPLGRIGFDLHLRRIRSFAKLTGEGVSLVHTDLAELLQSELPARFGGSALDYQLMEEEDGQGLTKLVLLVHPRVVIEDERAMRQVLLDGLRKGNSGAGYAAQIWERGNSLEVRSQEPLWTSAGKLLPLRRKPL